MTTTQGIDLDKLQRFNNRGGLMNPEPWGLYVRYEDVAAFGRQAAPEAPVATKAEIYTLRRLIECSEKLDERPRPMCRDCADENGTCPNSGLECDMRKLFADAKSLHNKLASTGAAPEAPTKDHLTPQSLALLRKGLRDWETPENRYAAQRVLDAIEAAPATQQAGAGKVAPLAAAVRAAERIDSMHKGVVGVFAALKDEHIAATTASASGETKPFECRTRWHNIPPCADCVEAGYCIGGKLADNRCASAPSQEAAPLIELIEMAKRHMSQLGPIAQARFDQLAALVQQDAAQAAHAGAVPEQDSIDAARYRFLVKDGCNMNGRFTLVKCDPRDSALTEMHGKEYDAAIDAAIASSAADQGEKNV